MIAVPTAARGRRRPRWWRASLIAALVVTLLAGLAVVAVWRGPERPEPPEPPSALAALMAMTEPDGSVSLDLARKAFALMIAPLPGVTPPAGVGDDRHHSGTLAISWLRAHWDALTPEQRAAAAPYVDPYGGTRGASGAFGAGGTLGASGPAARIGRAAIQRPATMPCNFKEPTRRGSASELTELRSLARKLAARFTPPIDLAADLQLCHARRDLPAKELTNGTTITTDAGTMTELDPATGRMRCWILLFPAAGKSEPARTRQLYHELTHCLQEMLRAREVGSIVPPVAWVSEGIAEWVASEITNTDWIQGDVYLEKSGLPLYQRWYDAVGFFSHLHDVRGDNWTTLPDIARASAHSGAQAFDTAVAGQRDDVLNSWPSSWFQDGRRGGVLGTTGPWRMGTIRSLYVIPVPTGYRLGHGGDPVVVPADPWAAGLGEVDLQAELVLLSLSEEGPAWGRFGPGPTGDFTLADASRRVFCTKPGGCTCQDGTPLPIAGGAADIPAGPALVAVTGGRGPAAAVLQGVRIDDFCANPRRYARAPAPVLAGPVPAGGCQGDCGGSNGDPHLVTFDGHYYDLQAVGEFVLTRSLDDGLAVQARTSPIEGSRHASMNTAFAMAVAGSRVGIYAEGDEVVVRVDGAATPVPPAGLALPGGGNLSLVDGAHSAVYRVAWPDGTAAWITPVLPWGLSLSMNVDPSRAGRLAGQLGDFDGDPDDDLTTREGRSLDLPAAFDDLYPGYADSWRITQAESLFDYRPGEDTGSFTDRAFPDDSPPSFDRAAAEAACREAGVTEPGLLENCVFDVGLTGDPIFAADTAQLQRFLADADGMGDGAVLAGELTGAGEPGEHVLELGDTTVFYLQDAGGTVSVCQVIFELAGAPTRRVEEDCTAERGFGLAGPAPDGKVLLRVLGIGTTGSYRFRLVTITVEEFTIRPGDEVSRRLEPATAHVYYLDTDRVFQLTGLPTSCGPLRWEHTEIVDAFGLGHTPFGVSYDNGPLCDQGRRILLVGNPHPDSRHVLVIRGEDTGSGGDYTFRIDP